MKVQTINNQNFEARRLRLPVRKLDLTSPELIQYGRSVKRVNLVKEYSDPRAKSLFEQANKSNNIREKARLLSEMGDYEVIDFGDGPYGRIRMGIYLALTRVTDLFA